MSEIGNLFVAGAACWVEFAPAAGNQLVSLSPSGTICTRSISKASSVLRPIATNQCFDDDVLDRCRRAGVEQIADGAFHSIGLSGKGVVFTWGQDQSKPVPTGQTGTLPSNRSAHCSFSKLRLEDVVSVAAGEAHSICIRYDGTVFGFGSNAQGQLGIRFQSDTAPKMIGKGGYQPVPRSISSLHRVRIASAACGSRFTLLVSEQGELFGMGEGGCGQLGVGRVRQIDTPTRIALEPTLPSETLLAAAESAGPLDGEQLRDLCTAAADSVSTRVVSVAAGWAHTLILTASGHVFATGFNASGQLGMGDTQARYQPALVYELISLPTSGSTSPVPGEEDGRIPPQGVTVRPFTAARVAAGKMHSALLAPTGTVFTFGSAADNRLGHSFDAAPASLTVQSVNQLEGGTVQYQLGEDGTGVDAPLSHHTLDQPSTMSDGLQEQAQVQQAPPVAPSYGNRWPFPQGTGPLKAPARGTDVTRPFSHPPHVTRNLGRILGKPAPAARDLRTGRPVFDDVHENTWQLRLLRSFSHSAMRDEEKEWGLQQAHVKARAQYDMVRDEEDLRMQALDALEAEVDPRSVHVPMGKPWLRTPVARVGCRPVTIPTPVQHPAFADRPVASVACSRAETLLFVPAVLKRVVPAACPSGGGTTLTLTGGGLASICKVAEQSMHAALALVSSPEDIQRIVRIHRPVRDDTGMIPIPGVYVRFACSFADLTSGSDKDAPGATAEVHACKAYYPHHYDFSGFDSVGSGNPSLSFQPDGSMSHTGGTGQAGPEEMDCLLTVAPTVTRPCTATVEIVVLDPVDPPKAVFGASGTSVVRGAARFGYYSQPTLDSMTPSFVSVISGARGAVLKLHGQNLFGTALVDMVARPAAEKLVQEVQEAVEAREAAEAGKVDDEARAITEGREWSPSQEPPRLIDLSRVAGSADEPCDIMVSVDVLLNGQHLGRTQALRGWYELLYREHTVDALAAKAAMIDAVRAGTAGSVGNRSGVVAPRSTPTGRAPPAMTQSADDSGFDPEEPAIVGSYDAVVCVELPDISALMGELVYPSITAGLQSTMAAIAQAALAGQADPTAAVESAALEALRAFDRGAAVIAAASGGSGHSITIRPKLSANGGQEWIEAQVPGVEAVAGRPAVTHCSPMVVHAEDAATITVFAMGIPSMSKLSISVHRVDQPDAPCLTLPGTLQEDGSIAVIVPPLAELFQGPQVELVEGEAPTVQPLSGFGSVQLRVSADGAQVPSAQPLLVTAYAGSTAVVGGSAYVAKGPGQVSLQLTAPNMPQCDAVARAQATGEADIAHLALPLSMATWLPPALVAGTQPRTPAVYAQVEGQPQVELHAVHDPVQGLLHVQLGACSLPSGLVRLLLDPDGVEGHAVSVMGMARLFDPASLVITGASPKKVVAGMSVDLSVDGLKVMLGLPIPPPPVKGKKEEPPTGPPPQPDFLPSAADVVVQLVQPGATPTADALFTARLPATIAPDYSGVKVALPAVDAAPSLPGATVTLALSVDGGLTFGKPFSLPIAKK